MQSTTQVQKEIVRLFQLFNELETISEHRRGSLYGAQADFYEEVADELTSHIAPAIRTLKNLEHRLRDHEEERQQLRALQKVGGVLNSSLDPDQTLNVVMDTMIRITGAERGFLMLMDEDTGDMVVEAARNILEESIDDPSEISSSVIEDVMTTGEPLLTTNAQDDPRFQNRQSIISYNLRSILCVPLNMKDDTIGVIYVDNRIADGIFRDTHRDLMAAFANQAAVAIENARLFGQIKSQLAEITEIKTLMDDVFASMSSGVITINNDDRIALYNAAAGRILGVPGYQVESKPYLDILSGVDQAMSEIVATMVSTVKMEGKLQRGELDVAVKNRKGITTVNLNLSPLRDMQSQMQGVAMVIDDISEKKRMESVKKYLPPTLVDQVRDLDAAQLPQRRELSVLFADITGFSSFSERLEPEKLIEVINEYFTIAAHAISLRQGIIDKFMGDAVMALFNTQLNPQEDHVEQAVRTALDMRKMLDQYLESVPQDKQLFFSIGINMGEAVAGNVGSSFRKDFTAIGDAVNLAKRLEELAESNQIVISQSVYENVKDWAEVEPLEPMRVKGRQALEQTYLLLGEK